MRVVPKVRTPENREKYRIRYRSRNEEKDRDCRQRKQPWHNQLPGAWKRGWFHPVPLRLLLVTMPAGASTQRLLETINISGFRLLSQSNIQYLRSRACSYMLLFVNQ